MLQDPTQYNTGLQLHSSYLLPPSSSSLEEEPIEKKRLCLLRSGEILREKLIRRFDRENPLTERCGLGVAWWTGKRTISWNSCSTIHLTSKVQGDRIQKNIKLTIYITVTDGNHGDGFGQGLMMEHGRIAARHWQYLRWCLKNSLVKTNKNNEIKINILMVMESYI